MKAHKKAVAAGQICLDITPQFPRKADKADISGKNILRPGKLIRVNGSDVHIGGAVPNTGIAMKLLGVDVKAVGKIGDDDFGKIVMNELEVYKMHENMLVEKGGVTSHSIVLALPGVDRIFVHTTGTNDTFSSEDVEKKLLEDVTLFHFGYPTVMEKIYQNNGEELVRLFRKVKETDTVTSLDMAAIDPESDAGEQDWEMILEKILPLTDIFVPSVEELGYMLERTLYQEWISRAEGEDIIKMITLDEVKRLGKRCLKLGAKIVLIKCGAAGMYYCTASSDEMKKLCEKLNLNLQSWEGKEGFEKSYTPEKVLSGTGAGDTSIAAFLTAILEEEDLEMALKLAAGEGASCVEAYDALSGLLTIDALKKKITDGWKKQDFACEIVKSL